MAVKKGLKGKLLRAIRAEARRDKKALQNSATTAASRIVAKRIAVIIAVRLHIKIFLDK